MKKVIILIALIFTIIGCKQEQKEVSIKKTENIFINRDFWKSTPTLTEVETQLKEGHDPIELTRFGFNGVVYSLLDNLNPEITLLLLSKEGTDLNKLTHDGRTYLLWAAYKGNLPIVKYLLNMGVKTDIIDDKGYSLLNFTAIGGSTNTELYDLILKTVPDISAEKTPKGANPLLLIAPSLEDFKMVDYFNAKGIATNSVDNDGNGIFNYVASKDNRKMLELLIEKGHPYKEPSKHGDNAMLAATLGSRKGYNTLDYFQYLENLGISPNITNNDGKTPLHNLATRNKDIPSLKYFIDKGVNVNQPDKKGNNALILSTRRNSLEAISLFANKTDDINAVNKDGQSALTHSLRNSTAVVNFLLDKGADATVIDKKGNDLMYYLFKYFNPKEKEAFNEKLALLTNQGLKVNSTQQNGNTLYHLATEKQSLEILNIIKDYGIDINAKNKQGLTALQQAVMSAKNHKIIKALVKIGANTNVKTDFDESLYDLAQENEALVNTDISYLK